MSDATLKGKFFQFPISALQSKSIEFDPIVIVQSCLFDVASKADPEDELVDYAGQHYSYELDDFEATEWNCRLAYAAGVLNVKIGSFDDTDRFEMSYEEIAARNNGESLVRVPTSLVWDCVNGNLEHLDFRLICAVYSAIGSDDAKLIRRTLIKARAKGFDSPSKVETKWDISDGTLRYRLDKLADRAMFFRVSPNKRDTYYGRNSKRLVDATANAVVRRIKKKEQRSRDTLNELLKQSIDAKLKGKEG